MCNTQSAIRFNDAAIFPFSEYLRFFEMSEPTRYLLQIVPKHFLHRIHDFCGAAEVLAVHVGLQLFPRLVCAVAASNILGYADLNAITTKIIALTRPDWAGFSLPLIIISDIGIFQRSLSSAVRSFT